MSDVERSVRDRIGLILKRDRVPPVKPEPPRKAALPASISPAQNAALAKLAVVYGRVVPAKRRALTSIELVALFDEHRCLDVVERLAKKRKESIRTTVLNHLDVTVEATGASGDVAIDRAGHYLVANRVAIAGADEVFAWEITDPSPDIDFSALRSLADDPDVGDFTHTDWLAMTTQTRTFDEVKARAAIEVNPNLLEVMATVSAPGRRDGRFSIRPTK